MPPPSSTLPSTLLHEIHTHTYPITTLTFSSQSGTFILTGSSDRQIHLTRAESQSQSQSSLQKTTTPIQRYTSHGYPILDIHVSASNTTFVSSSADRSGPFLWDINLATSTQRRFGSNSPTPHTARINCVRFAGAGDSVVVSGSDDRTVKVWDGKSRDARAVMSLDEARDGVTALECVGAEIVSGSSDGRVRSYDVRMGRVVTDVFPGAVGSLWMGREGRTVLVGCLDGGLRVMDRERGTCLRKVPGEVDGGAGGGHRNESLRLQSCLAVNDGLVLSGSEADGRVRAWDVLSGKMVGDMEVGTDGKVVSVVKWREGSEVEKRRGIWAAGGADGVARVYG